MDRLFVNLRIISKLPEHGRIGTTSAGEIYIEKDKIQTTLLRTLTGDSRDKSIDFLTSLMNDVQQRSDNIINALYIAKHHDRENANNIMTLEQINENAKKSQQLNKLIREVRNSKSGINNLLSTYKKDATISAKIEEILDKADLQIEKIERALKIIEISDKETIESLKTSETKKNINQMANQPLSQSRPTRTQHVVNSSSENEDSDDEIASFNQINL